MRIFGYILFIISVIFASVFASPEEPIWVFFSISIISALIGALFVRFAKNDVSLFNTVNDTDINRIGVNLYSNLNDIYEKTGRLVNFVFNEEIANSEIKKSIEDILEKIRIFIDNRDSAQSKYGIRNTTKIYSSFAGGERYLLRAWSALVDGYLDEMKDCLKKSETRFRDTEELFEKMVKSE